jgi:hypothetical protein
MMTQTPETDLGVVATVEQAAEVAEPPVTEQSLGADEPAPIDVPAFEPATEALPAAEENAAMGADDNLSEDLPPVDAADGTAPPVPDDN